jgi:hypothetical protein
VPSWLTIFTISVTVRTTKQAQRSPRYYVSQLRKVGAVAIAWVWKVTLMCP